MFIICIHADRLFLNLVYLYLQNYVYSFRFANEKNKRLSAYLSNKVNQRREVIYRVI